MILSRSSGVTWSCEYRSRCRSKWSCISASVKRIPSRAHMASLAFFGTGGPCCCALNSTRSPISWNSLSSPAVRMRIVSGHLTSANPAAVLKETPRIGLTVPRSSVRIEGVLSCHPTVDSCVQK